jgi:hypothetical protein
MGSVGHGFELDMSKDGRAVPLVRHAHAGVQALPQRGQALSLTLLRFFLRLAPPNASGCSCSRSLSACGLAAVAFHLAIQSAEALLIDQALAMPAPT